MPNVTKTLKKDPKGKQKYLAKCIPVVMKEGKKSQNQAIAQCNSMWEHNWHQKRKKSKASNLDSEQLEFDLKNFETKMFNIRP